jgi:hypothetical protein
MHLETRKRKRGLRAREAKWDNLAPLGPDLWEMILLAVTEDEDAVRTIASVMRTCRSMHLLCDGGRMQTHFWKRLYVYLFHPWNRVGYECYQVGRAYWGSPKRQDYSNWHTQFNRKIKRHQFWMIDNEWANGHNIPIRWDVHWRE